MSYIKRAVAAVIAFIKLPAVQSPLRHALIAGGAVILAAITVGGVNAITTGVVIAALAAGGRILWLAIQAYVTKQVEVS